MNYQIIKLSVALICGCALISALLFPIYPDEVTIRIWMSRFFIDGAKLNSALPCLASNLQDASIFLWIPLIFESVFHGLYTNPVQLRISSALSTSLFVYLGYKIFAAKYFNKFDSIFLALAPLALGVFPLFLIANRNEQLILLCIITLCYLCIAVVCRKHLSSFVAFVLPIVLINIALFAHAKSIFFLPFFIYSLIIIQKSRNYKLFILSVSIVLISSIQVVLTYKTAYICTELPQFENSIKSFTLSPSKILTNPNDFIQDIISSIKNIPKLAAHLFYAENFEVGYIKNIEFKYLFVLNIAVSVLFFAYLGITIFSCAKTYFNADTKRMAILAFLILLSGLFISIFNLTKHWYDGAFMYALFVICFYVVIDKRVILLHKYVIGILMPITFISVIAFISLVIYPYLQGYAGPGISVVKYPFKSRSFDLDSASRACSLSTDNSNSLILDNFTYYHFRNTKRPFLGPFILGNDENFIAGFVRDSDSDGLVMLCTAVLDRYKPELQRSGDICCLSRKSLRMHYNVTE